MERMTIVTMALSKREEKDILRYQEMSQIEICLYEKGYSLLAGVDEAGRGPLAGPVYAAAVILNPEKPIYGLNDSKKLSEKMRINLAEKIKTDALAWAIAKRDNKYIDEFNILEATKSAMLEAATSLNPTADFFLFDAIHLNQIASDKQMKVIKGDAKSNAIAAASILAKIARDAELIALDKNYPQYGFKKHKGYGTKEHYEALDKFGPCDIHRETFLESWYKRREGNG